MIRRAFTMRLKPGALEEYRRKHDDIWPELVREIEASGIATMSTFEADPLLFLYSEITDEAAWDRLWKGDLHMRWGKQFEHLMEIRPDGIVDSGELNEIFHLDTNPPGA